MCHHVYVHVLTVLSFLDFKLCLSCDGTFLLGVLFSFFHMVSSTTPVFAFLFGHSKDMAKIFPSSVQYC